MNGYDVILSFIDVETGGLDETKHALLEVAVVKLRPGGHFVGAPFTSKVRALPGRLICDEAKALHGFDGSAGMDSAELYEALRWELRGTIPVGYNLQFDMRFIHQLALDVGGAEIEWTDHHQLDVAALAMPLWLDGKIESCKLQAVAAYLGVIPYEPKHTALADCMTTLAVYNRLAGTWR